MPPRERLAAVLDALLGPLTLLWSAGLSWLLLVDLGTVRGFAVLLGGVAGGIWLVRGPARRCALVCAWCRRPATHLLRRPGTNETGPWPWWPVCRADAKERVGPATVVVSLRSLV